MSKRILYGASLGIAFLGLESGLHVAEQVHKVQNAAATCLQQATGQKQNPHCELPADVQALRIDVQDDPIMYVGALGAIGLSYAVAMTSRQTERKAQSFSPTYDIHKKSI